MESVAGRYDPAAHTFVATLTHLSNFTLAWLNPNAILGGFEDAIKATAGVTGIAGSKPPCANQAVTLPTGTKVRSSTANQSGPLWLCLKQGANNQIKATVHSGDALPWRVRSAAGQYEGPAETQSADVALQALYETLASDRAHADGLIVPNGDGTWDLAEAALPTEVQAKVSVGSYLAAEVIFASIFLVDVASSGARTPAAVANAIDRTITGRASILDCFSSAAAVIPDGTTVTVDNFARLGRAALNCVGPIADQMYKGGLTAFAKTAIDIVGTGLAVAYAGLEGVVRTASHRDLITWRISSDATIRQIDLANAEYPAAICESLKPYRMRLGEALVQTSSAPWDASYNAPAQYVDINGDGHEEAVVRIGCRPDPDGEARYDELAVLRLAPSNLLQLVGIITARHHVAGQLWPTSLESFATKPGVVTVEEGAYTSTDPHCCPSSRATTIWKWQNGRLVATN